MLHECLAAYRWLRCQDVPSHCIILAGDSAGGGLVLSALVALRDVADDLPAVASTRRVPPVSIVELEIWNDMVHIWPFFAAILPEGQQAIEPWASSRVPACLRKL
jgi:acetyl esterase/lipase